MTLIRTLSAAMAFAVLIGPAAAQQPAAQQPAAPQVIPPPEQPNSGPPPDPPREVQVLPIKNSSAAETAVLLSQLFGNAGRGNRPNVRVVPDARSNSLLVQASPAELETIRTLLARLDAAAPAEAEAPQRFNIYSLKNIEPDKSLEEALKIVTRGPFSLDRQRKLVIVRADRRGAEEVEALLSRMEAQANRPLSQDVQVRVVWLVSGPTKEEAPPLPGDLKNLTADLARLGIDHPRLAAQALVNVTPGAEFQASGRASLSGDCPFSVAGRYTDKRDVPSLHLFVRATRRGAGPEAVDLGHVQTDITAPPGHLVVLGVTPTDTLTSVFVVQVLRPGAGK
jgi:hypothetical protein